MGFGNLSILSIVSKQRYSNRTENRRVEKIADFIEPGSVPLLTMIVTDIVLSLLLNYNLIMAGQTKQTGSQQDNILGRISRNILKMLSRAESR